jgi:hypothetical protein
MEPKPLSKVMLNASLPLAMRVLPRCAMGRASPCLVAARGMARGTERWRMARRCLGMGGPEPGHGDAMATSAGEAALQARRTMPVPRCAQVRQRQHAGCRRRKRHRPASAPARLRHAVKGRSAGRAVLARRWPDRPVVLRRRASDAPQPEPGGESSGVQGKGFPRLMMPGRHHGAANATVLSRIGGAIQVLIKIYKTKTEL